MLDTIGSCFFTSHPVPGLPLHHHACRTSWPWCPACRTCVPRGTFYTFEPVVAARVVELQGATRSAHLALAPYGKELARSAATTPESLSTGALPHQDAFLELALHRFDTGVPGILLADEMGLGKTRTAIELAERIRGGKPVVVICPASVRATWRKELKRWAPGSVDAYTLASYDILIQPVHRTRLLANGPTVLIADEAHWVSHPSSDRAFGCRLLADKIPFRIGLTGTPIAHKVHDLIGVLASLCLGGPWGGYIGLKKLVERDAELARDTLRSTVMVRRRSSQLPGAKARRTRTLVSLPTPEGKPFLEALKLAHGQPLPSRLGEIQGERRRVGLEKLPFVTRRARALASRFEEKIVLFAHHLDVGRSLVDRLGDRAVLVEGSVPPEKRQEKVDAFESDESIRYFVGTYGAAGTGITLNAGARVMLVELPWRFSETEQAEERIGRIGCNRTDVTTEFIVWDGTIEVEMARRIVANAKTAATVTEYPL